jgi:hypothetical protein
MLARMLFIRSLDLHVRLSPISTHSLTLSSKISRRNQATILIDERQSSVSLSHDVSATLTLTSAHARSQSEHSIERSFQPCPNSSAAAKRHDVRNRLLETLLDS